ncbi:hypothetical protein O6H91_18G002300 [Diphasiastrum complanatum]|uniref:Uncharacterized protein n=1 Tax=Diphasiastrum complanatum TaxID=34168 RepID=A0ACC2AXQ5_DIPCM|nr:hypothetical protein O6H91_18G002300 [Diphasiastrum complanatum]
MRALCDVCEAGPAQWFCAADEAALCLKCDEKVHGCNKLASRHVRLELAEARSVPICDICENAPAFFFCGIDGTSLCLQCDMDAHTGGKKTHERYLMMGQRVEIPSQKPRREEAASTKLEDCIIGYQLKQVKRPILLHSDNSDAPAFAIALGDVDMQQLDNQDSPMIDLNFRPYQQQGQDGPAEDTSSSEPSSYDDDYVGVVPEMNAVEMEDANH